MHDYRSLITKLITTIACLYGQIAPRTLEVIEHEKTLVINQYFYFTHICLALTMVMLILSLFEKPKSTYLYKFILPNLIIYELLIMLIFWPLYFINPILIVGKICAKKENQSLPHDLCQHLFPIIGLVVLFHETQIEHDKRRYFMNIFAAIAYTVMLRYNKKIKGQYQYGFLDGMSDLQIFFIFVPFLVVIFNGVLYFIVLGNKKYRLVMKKN